jgi:hypothetical protein
MRKPRSGAGRPPVSPGEEEKAMTMTDEEKLNQDLEELGQRLRKRTQEFRTTGGFTFLNQRFLHHVERDNARLRAKVEMAVRAGGVWEFARTELWRDLETLANNLVALEERLDADHRTKA